MSAQTAPAQPVRRPRWGHQTSLFQLRQPAFWLYAILMVLTGFVAMYEQKLFRQAAPGGWALSWLLLLLYAVPVFLAVYLLDLYEREPLTLVFGALAWGAIAATTLSGFANAFWGLFIANVTDPDFASRWTAALTAPFVEETLKYLGVVLIYLIARSEVDDELDGFVFGAMSGLGFAVVEDVYYFIQHFGGTLGGVLAGFLVRVVGSGFYTHVLWTAVSGMGLGYFVSRRGEVPFGRRFRIAAGLFLLAVAGHFLWNSPLLNSLYPDTLSSAGDWLQLLFGLAVKGVPMLVFVIMAVRLAHRREGRLLSTVLEEELRRGVLTPEELAVLTDAGRRRAARRAIAARLGPRAAGILKRVQRAQINLAMIRTRVDSDDHPDLVRQREYIRSLRDALAAMPTGAPGAPAPSG